MTIARLVYVTLKMLSIVDKFEEFESLKLEVYCMKPILATITQGMGLVSY